MTSLAGFCLEGNSLSTQLRSEDSSLASKSSVSLHIRLAYTTLNRKSDLKWTDNAKRPPHTYFQPHGPRRISHAKLTQTPNSTSATTNTRPSPPPAVLHPRSFPTELLLIIFSYVFNDLATFCIDSEHEARKECAAVEGYHGERTAILDEVDRVSGWALSAYSRGFAIPLAVVREIADRGSSSLPSLVDDFGGVGGAPLLTDLRLECEVDDQRDYPGVRVAVPGRDLLLSPALYNSVDLVQFSCPALTAISLNGRNFRDLSLAIRRGYEFSALQHIEKFTISHYSASLPQSYGFTLSNMLQVIRRERMPRLAFLKLVDLDIQLPDLDADAITIHTLIGSVEISALNIHLEELDADVIKHFCTAIELVHDLESFHIIRSPIPDDTWDIPDTCDLMLEEVNDLKGVRSPVKEWIGNRLVFTGCNGFDDEFLRMLRSSGSVLFLPPAFCGGAHLNAASALGSTATVVPPSSFAFNCPNLQEIYLNDCMNYSIAELKRVIAARNAGLVPRGRRAMESDGPPCILELYVTGIGPELSPGDRQWFEQRLPIFYWETRP
ncbi:hypothetical protein P691DRAFT_781376 [Macrolepiota fuliginosa MF-IS2]|uniref:Uncharacterized protein n=1 Tax=Macrolepiota fuliginosa MF-IS2 TaxID=1400762 RepID=A0A9P5XQF3_9AGAR|nr:hypothetical protein P691DRAFT_781376 [Macrolepiota fuliginosa MF-IS2]